MVTRQSPAFRAHYPFESRYFDRQGIAYHYLDEGPKGGVPVVMVHGNPTWSFYYRKLVQAMRDTRRCLVPDHVGMGFSDKPGDGRYAYTLDSRVADLDAWLSALGVECVDVVAHDWGGMIASAWMVANADRVRRIVLMNTAAFRNPRGRTIPPTLKLARDSALGALLVRGLNAFSRGATHLAVERKMAKDVRDGYTLPYDSWDNRIATLRFVQDIPLEPGDPAWRTIESTEASLQRLANKPIFLPWGLKDFVFDEKFLDRFIEAWPHAEVERYPEAGHYLLEDAGHAVIRRIVDFLGA